LVADGVMWTSPASSKILPVALDSPENGRPMTPMIESSLTTWVTGPVALFGSPSVSNFLKATWQPGLALLCWSMASWTPF